MNKDNMAADYALQTGGAAPLDSSSTFLRPDPTVSRSNSLGSIASGISRLEWDDSEDGGPPDTLAVGEFKNMTLKEQNAMFNKLRKENWRLKLKIYFMERMQEAGTDEGLRSIMAENASLKTAKLELAKELRNAKKANIDLQTKLKDKTTTQASQQDSAMELENEITLLHERIESYRVEVEKLREEVDNKDGEKSHITSPGNSQAEKLRQEIDNLRQDLGIQTSLMTSRNRERERLYREIEELKMGHRQDQRSSSATCLESQHGDNFDGEFDTEALRSQIEQLRDSYAKVSLENQELYTTMKGLVDELDEKKLKLDGLEEAKQEYDEWVKQADTELHDMQNERNQAHEGYESALQHFRESAQQSINSLQNDLEQSVQRIEQLEEEVKQRDEEYDQLQNRARMTGEGLDRIEADAQTKARRIAELELEKKEISWELECAQRIIDGFSGRIRTLERDLTNEHQQLENNLELKTRRLDRLESIIQQERISDVANTAPEIAKLKNENRTLKSEIMTLREREQTQANQSPATTDPSPAPAPSTPGRAKDLLAKAVRVVTASGLKRHSTTSAGIVQTRQANPGDLMVAPNQSIDSREALWAYRVKDMDYRLTKEREARQKDRDAAIERLIKAEQEKKELKAELERVRGKF